MDNHVGQKKNSFFTAYLPRVTLDFDRRVWLKSLAHENDPQV